MRDRLVVLGLYDRDEVVLTENSVLPDDLAAEVLDLAVPFLQAFRSLVERLASFGRERGEQYVGRHLPSFQPLTPWRKCSSVVAAADGRFEIRRS